MSDRQSASESGLIGSRPRQTANLLLPYGIALLSVALALTITLMLGELLRPTPLPLFFLAVMVSAWFGGWRSGLCATVLAILTVNYGLMEPYDSLNFTDLGTVMRLGLFALTVTLVIWLIQSRQTAQRQAELARQSLRESEARFSCLADSKIIGMVISDRNGIILEANETFLAMVGYTQAELRSRQVSWHDLTSPDDQPMSEQCLQALQAARVCPPFEQTFIRKDGSLVPMLLNFAIAGEQTAVGFALDLSDRQQAETAQIEAARREQALRTEAQTAKDHLENVLAKINDQFVVLDQDWCYTYVNDHVAAVMGWQKADLIGKCVWDLFPYAIDSSLYQEAHRAVAEQVQVSHEFFSTLMQRWLETRIYPSGLGVAMLATDITERKRLEDERKQAEAELRATEAELRQKNAILDAINESAPTPIFVKDRQGRMIYANPATLKMLGKAADEVIGYGDRDLYPQPEDALTVMANDRRIMASGLTEVVEECPDGVRTFLAMKSPYRNAAGEVIGIIGISNDISDRVQLERDREQLLQQEQAARKASEDANRIKDEFLAVLSHELRTPLNPILGWSKLLRSKKLDEATTNRALETIERNAHLQTQLIEDLLDVSRILQGKFNLNVNPVDLVLTIRAAIETVRLASEAKALQLQVTFAGTVQVLGDAGRLQQVIWNLLSNAVKFTPIGGQVYIRLEQMEQQVLVIVSDTGKGIAPEFLPHVFECFRQADSATTRKFGGLGLGLAIVRQIVELHGGRVFAESPGEGQGSTFTVRLPLLESAPLPEANAAPRAVSASLPLAGLRILVIDDDADSRNFIASVLEQEQATVIALASASEAVRALTQHKPDVIVSDIGMPEVDGYMLIQQIRALPPEQGEDMPAIALTAYAGEADQQAAIAAGFQVHLSKPVQPATIIAAIARLCGRQEEA